MRKLRYLLISCVALLGVGLWASAENPDFKVGRNIQILFNLFRELNLLYVDPIDADKMLEDAAAGMVARLDPYTELIPESEMEEFETLTTGKYGGIGSLIRQQGDYVTIAQPYRNSPADRAGLLIGDKIVSINGESAKGFASSKVSSLMKGTPGSVLHLQVERMLTGKVEPVTIKRERIVVSGISYCGMLENNIGYIIFNNFTDECSNDIRKAVVELKKQGMTALVLDLRGNGGGILQEAVKIISLFVPKGTEVVSMRGRSNETNAIFRTETDPMDTEMPVAVLVNSMSASSSEIVAGAFQDLDRGLLVGQRTFGKGLVQATRPLGYNSYLKVTTAKYYIPSGRCIQAIDYTHRNVDGSVGLLPDSLMRSFNTLGGRTVYDGGGIMPDVRIAPSYVSGFTVALYNRGYIENFANEYFKKHYTQPVEVDKFALSEAEYNDFVHYMADKEVEFESETRATIKELRKKAERERYLERIEGELKAMEEKIKTDKTADLKLFRPEISRLLEEEIVLRFHYMDGVERHKTHYDSELEQAVKALTDRERYQTILTSVNPERK